MIGLFGYNFFGDGNAIDPMPTNVNGINSSRVGNGIIDHFLISRNTGDTDTVEPTEWNVDYILNAAFNGNLSAGSLEQSAGNITGYKVKRRKFGEFEWITIFEKETNDPNELSFTIRDNINQNNVEYEYAFVPMYDGKEGQYIIQSVLSKFDGVFFVDNQNSFKIDTAVSYGSLQNQKKIGVYEPFGKKYPVVVSNGNTNYERGSVSATILPDSYDPKAPLQRNAIREQRKLFTEFLTNNKPKILKDWNGNFWLCMVVTNPSADFLQGSAMGLASVSAEWVEVGDSNNSKDLCECGLIPSVN